MPRQSFIEDSVSAQVLDLHDEKIIKIGNQVITFLLATLYLLILMLYPQSVTRDYFHFLIYAEDSLILFSNLLNGSFLEFLLNEPLWLLANVFLREILNISPENIVKVWSLISGLLVMIVLLRICKSWVFVFMIILLHPEVFSKFVEHIRQGLATACFLVGWLGWNRSYKITGSMLMFASSLIHISCIWACALFIIAEIIVAVNNRWAYYFVIIAMLGLMLFLGFNFSTIASEVGFRQAKNYMFQPDKINTGLGWWLYLIIFLFMVTASKAYLRNHFLGVINLIAFISWFWFFEFSARLFGSLAPLTYLAMYNLSGLRKYFSVTAMVTIIGFSLWSGRHYIMWPWWGDPGL